MLARQPHWAATAAAAARHPALHLAMRQTLHGWLAASGSPVAWRLLLLLLRAAAGARGQQLERDGQLPAELRVLYPADLVPAAALLHTQPPSAAGLDQAVALLRAYIAAASGAPSDSGLPLAQRQQQQQDGSDAQPVHAWDHASCEQQRQRLAAGRQRQAQAWQLVLDAPAWVLFCLQQLPLQQLLEAGTAADDAGSMGPASPSPAPAPAGHRQAGASAAAADFVGLLLWPGQARQWQVLREVLALELANVDLPAILPWLQSWQRVLQGHPHSRTGTPASDQ